MTARCGPGGAGVRASGPASVSSGGACRSRSPRSSSPARTSSTSWPRRRSPWGARRAATPYLRRGTSNRIRSTSRNGSGISPSGGSIPGRARSRWMPDGLPSGWRPRTNGGGRASTTRSCSATTRPGFRACSCAPRDRSKPASARSRRVGSPARCRSQVTSTAIRPITSGRLREWDSPGE